MTYSHSWLERPLLTLQISSESDEIHILLGEPVVLIPFSQKCQLLLIPSFLLSFGAVVNSSAAS